MPDHTVVSSDQWLDARLKLLKQKKEFSRLRDQLTHSAADFPGKRLVNVYYFLDIVPQGRDEQGLPYGMAWVRHHDQYGDQAITDPDVELDS